MSSFYSSVVPSNRTRLNSSLMFAAILFFVQNSVFAQKSARPKAVAKPAVVYTFMGLVAGQSKDEANSIVEALNSTFTDLEKLQPPTCSRTLAGLSGRGLEACFFSVKYASLPAYSRSHSFVLLFIDGRLARADFEFDQDGYESMVTAIVRKYGKPDESKLVKMSNAFGAALTSRNYSWKSGSSRIATSEVGSTSEKSAVHVEDFQLRTEFEKRTRENGPPI